MSELKKALTRTDVTKELQRIRALVEDGIHNDQKVIDALFDLQMKVANAKVIR
jgi:hypothetical protein